MVRGRIYRRSVTQAVIKGLGIPRERSRDVTQQINVSPAMILGDDLDLRVRGRFSACVDIFSHDWDRVAQEGSDALLAIVTRECLKLMRGGWVIDPDDSRLPRSPVPDHITRAILGRMEVGPRDEAHHVTSMIEFLESFGAPNSNGGPKGGDDR